MSDKKPRVPNSGSWKPGQSGNPTGGIPMSAELRKIKRLTGDRFTALVTRYANMDKAQLQAVEEDPTTATLDLVVVSILRKALQHGDQGRLSFLLDRTIGKVKEVKEIQMPEPLIIRRPSGEEIELTVAKPMVIDEDGDE